MADNDSGQPPNDGDQDTPPEDHHSDDIERDMAILRVLNDKFVPWFEVNIGAKLQEQISEVGNYLETVNQNLAKLPDQMRQIANDEVMTVLEGVAVAQQPNQADPAQELIDGGADPQAAASEPSRVGSIMERVSVASGSDGVGQFMKALPEMAEQFFKMFTQFKGGGAQTPTQQFAKLAQDDPGMAGYIAGLYAPRDSVEDGLTARLPEMLSRSGARGFDAAMEAMKPAMREAWNRASTPEPSEGDGPPNPTAPPATLSLVESPVDGGDDVPALMQIANGAR